MTDEQWNIIDDAINEYEEYGNKVQKYILFLMGYHTEEAGYKVISDVPNQIEKLKQDRYSQALEVIEDFFGGFGIFENANFNKGEQIKQNSIHEKYLVVTRNTANWLNAAMIYYQELTSYSNTS